MYVLDEQQFYQFDGDEWKAIGGQESLTGSLTAPGVACDLEDKANLSLGNNPRSIAIRGAYAYVTVQG